MRLLLPLITLICAGQALAKEPSLKPTCHRKPIKIAVLDTGFDIGNSFFGYNAKLCKYGHKDFSKEKKFIKTSGVNNVPKDTHGHGTHIVGIIDKLISEVSQDYCIVIIKYYSEKQTGVENLLASNKALTYALNIGVNVINYSGGGPETSSTESSVVKKFLDRDGILVAAAGNEKSNLEIKENRYFPAQDDTRAVVVGNLKKNGQRHGSSNYGSPVTRWEVGEDVESFGFRMTGTSQATAVATGKIVREILKSCDR